jgi:hypothetical protein
VSPNVALGAVLAITPPADRETAVLAQMPAFCRGFPIKASPRPYHLGPRRGANPPVVGQRKGGSRGYWLVSQRFTHGRLEFADAALELDDRLGRSRRGRDSWREKCEDAKHRHQKLQKLDGDWLAVRPDTGSDWSGLARVPERGDRGGKEKAGLRSGGRIPAEVINEGQRDYRLIVARLALGFATVRPRGMAAQFAADLQLAPAVAGQAPRLIGLVRWPAKTTQCMTPMRRYC